MADFQVRDGAARLNLRIEGTYYYGYWLKGCLPIVRSRVEIDIRAGQYEECGFCRNKDGTCSYVVAFGGYKFRSFAATSKDEALQQRNQFRDTMAKIRAEQRTTRGSHEYLCAREG